jgi:hypothetical protein
MRYIHVIAFAYTADIFTGHARPSSDQPTLPSEHPISDKYEGHGNAKIELNIGYRILYWTPESKCKVHWNQLPHLKPKLVFFAKTTLGVRFKVIMEMTGDYCLLGCDTTQVMDRYQTTWCCISEDKIS